MDGKRIVVQLQDGGPWGFRLGGGADFGCPLQVAKVRVNSKAYEAGLEEGDIIVQVEARNISLCAHGEAMKIIEQSGDDMSLTILRDVSSLENIYNQFLSEEAAAQAGLNKNYRQGGPEYITVTRSRDPSPVKPVTQISTRVSGSVASVASSEPVPVARQQSTTRQQSATRLHVFPSAEIRRSSSSVPPVSPKSMKSPQFEGLNFAPNNVHSRPHTPTNQPLHVQTNFGSTISLPVNHSANRNAIVVPIKPFEVQRQKSQEVSFKIRDLKRAGSPSIWKPDYEDGTQYPGRNKLGDIIQYPVDPPTGVPTNARTQDHISAKEPRMFYWELMGRQPERLPGYLDPLIIDDTQGDFGGNPLVQPEKNVYSNSSFYDTKNHQFPTIPEQMNMCRHISSILANPQSMRSKGGKMFHKRRNKAPEWTLEAQGRRHEREFDGGIDGYDMAGYHHWPSSMKSHLSCDELERLEHNTENLSKHDYLPPVVAFCVNTALLKNHGKAREIFAKNKERADSYTVDENNRRRVSHPNALGSKLEVYSHFSNYKSPWEAASEGNIERAFRYLDPMAAQSVRDEPWLRKDENPHNLEFDHQNAVFGVRYKDVRHVEPSSNSRGLRREISQSLPGGLDQKVPRLVTLIKRNKEQEPTLDTYSHKWCIPSYGGKDVMTAPVESRYSVSDQPGWYRRPRDHKYNQQTLSTFGGSMGDIILRRPKDFIRMSQSNNTPAPTPSNFKIEDLPPQSGLYRPRQFLEPHTLSNQYQTTYGIPNESHNQNPVSVF